MKERAREGKKRTQTHHTNQSTQRKNPLIIPGSSVGIPLSQNIPNFLGGIKKGRERKGEKGREREREKEMSYERQIDEENEVIEIEMNSISSSLPDDTLSPPSSSDRFITDSDEYFGGKGLSAHVEEGEDAIVKGSHLRSLDFFSMFAV